MCLMCLEIQKDRMKLYEVVRALGEYVPEKDHEEELINVIFDKFGAEEAGNEIVRQGFEKLEKLNKVIK